MTTTCFTIIFLLQILFNTEFVSSNWDYKHEAEWPSLCKYGKRQSPIDLESDSAERKDFVPFRFSGYHQNYAVNVKNNGHSAEIRLQTAGKPNVKGGGLLAVYNLDHLHFHWSSEHTIKKYRFPLELHLVHYDNKHKSLQDALKFNDGVAVLAVLFDLSPEDDKDYETLIKLIDHLKNDRLGYTLQMHLRIEDYLPRDTAGFYRYDGSLTTPNCTEGVIWTVFTDTIPISKHQIESFASLKINSMQKLDKNYRSLKNLNKIKVQLKVSPHHNSSRKTFIFYKEFFVVVLLYNSFKEY